MSFRYLLYMAFGAVAQVIATILLLMMLRLRNFAVGTVLTKVDIVFTAVIGWLFFSERFSAPGVLALVVIAVGVILMSAARANTVERAAGGSSFKDLLRSPATHIALGCAFSFSLSYLFLREAMQAMGGGTAIWRGAWTVFLATGLQVLMGAVWLTWSEPKMLKELWPNRAISTFIGITSALGSIAWYTAFALENAAYVRAVGQIEVVFTLLVSWLYFREKLTPLELFGIALTVAGVVIFRLGV